MARVMKMQGGFADKQVARVLTVDQVKRRVECALKDGGLVYAAVWELPVVFRWPKVGEVWTIRRDSGIWRLDSLMENHDIAENATNLLDMEEGQARIITEPSEDGSGLIINKFHATRVAPEFLIGDGFSAEFEVEHNLGTRKIKTEIVEVSTGTVVGADLQVVDENVVYLAFGIAPTANQYRVTVFG